MPSVGEVLLAFVVLYPVCTAAMWVAGGLLFRLLDEPTSAEAARGRLAGGVRADPRLQRRGRDRVSVAAALAVDYPELEVLVLDDGSTDRHRARGARRAAGDDRRCRVMRDPVNRGKADRLNFGSARLGTTCRRHRADTHLHPEALKLLAPGCPARRWSRPWRARRTSPTGAAAARHAGTRDCRDHRADPPNPVADRTGGRRRGRPGLFRRDRVLDVGGYDARHGDRGHRPDLEAAARGLGDRVRAARARRHAGPLDATGTVGAAHTLGPWPGRGAAHSPAR